MTQFQHNAPEPYGNTRGALQLFDISGADIRFGMTEDGIPYAVASDFAKTMGYRDAEKATRLLDEDEKGTQIVGTPGGPQQMNVIYEDGLWELIFRSTLPGAKAIKARVKAILREIRETGRYETAGTATPQDYEEALVHLLHKVRENKALGAANKVLAPKAGKWDRFCNSDGLIDMAAAAQAFHHVSGGLGRTKFMQRLRDGDVRFLQVQNRRIPYECHVQKGRAEVKFVETGNGRWVEQTFLTPKGMDWLADKFGMGSALPAA